MPRMARKVTVSSVPSAMFCTRPASSGWSLTCAVFADQEARMCGALSSSAFWCGAGLVEDAHRLALVAHHRAVDADLDLLALHRLDRHQQRAGRVGGALVDHVAAHLDLHLGLGHRALGVAQEDGEVLVRMERAL